MIIFNNIHPLGSVAYSSSSSLFGIGTAPTLMFGVACSGHETNLLDCPFSPFPNAVCSHYYDVGVKCEGKESSDLGVPFSNLFSSLFEWYSTFVQ